jgi:hypothetical protein
MLRIRNQSMWGKNAEIVTPTLLLPSTGYIIAEAPTRNDGGCTL